MNFFEKLNTHIIYRMIIYSENIQSDKLSFMGPKIWSLISSNLKNSETLEIFKLKIRYWKPDNCPLGFGKPTLKTLDIYKGIAFHSISIYFCFEEPLTTNYKYDFSFFFIIIFSWSWLVLQSMVIEFKIKKMNEINVGR